MFLKKDKKIDLDIYKLIAENTTDLIAVSRFSINTEVLYANPSYEDSLGYKPEEIVGKTSFLLLHPDDKIKIKPLLLKYLKMKAKLFLGKESENVFEKIEFRLHDKKGNWHYFESTVNAVGNYFIFISKEVTEKKKNEKKIKEEKDFSEDIMNSLPGIFYVIRKDGSYEKWNKNFEIITGYSSDEIKKMNPADFFDKEDKQVAYNAMSDVFQKDKEVSIEANLMNKKGEKTPYYFNGKKMQKGGEEYLIGMGIDISKRKKFEEELLEKNEFLEKMNKATIDRELKMIELKKKLKED